MTIKCRESQFIKYLNVLQPLKTISVKIVTLKIETGDAAGERMKEHFLSFSLLVYFFLFPWWDGLRYLLKWDLLGFAA